MVLIALTALSACANATARGTDAGCAAYGEERLNRPGDADLLATPDPVFEWIDRLDVKMTAVCR